MGYFEILDKSNFVVANRFSPGFKQAKGVFRKRSNVRAVIYRYMVFPRYVMKFRQMFSRQWYRTFLWIF